MIFITGHEGFIGTHLCNRLTELGGDFKQLERNELPGPFIELGYGGTIGGSAEDTLIHLAATTTLSTDFHPELFDNNIVYPARLFESFPGRIIYASSTSAAELTNPYAYTKRYLEYLGEKHGNAVGLRLFNVYGNGCKRGIIKAAIDAANSGETLNVYGGHQVRDFVYIDDVIDRIIQAIDAKPGIYDVGTGKGTEIVDAIRAVSRTMQKKITIKRNRINDTDMQYSVAPHPQPVCLTLEQGLTKMLCES